MWWLVSSAWAMDLSYDEALKRAFERNPTLVSAGYDLESAEGQLVGVRRELRPDAVGTLEYYRQLIEQLDSTVDAIYVETERPLIYGVGVERVLPDGDHRVAVLGGGHYHSPTTT